MNVPDIKELAPSQYWGKGTKNMSDTNKNNK
jgi:hypothetical protein